uniref:LOW QUALITY PROTEIN: protein TSSC4-like n=1 Tax=Styela clava TaxID=7725 RepID=UPI00193A0E36|nr:LOW QUALITY PROTEIN: protein TSSC4-like [Styela clava]
MDTDEKSPGFTISCENPVFASKMHEIFSGIDSSASNMISSDSAIESDDSEQDDNDCRIKKVSNNKSKALIKPPKPDFLVNPSRYTKYSLRDTELSDNKSNTQIAFQFLRELSNKEDSITGIECSVTSKQHVFKMPEHAAGVPNENKRKTDSKPNINSDEILCDKVELDHLEENISAAEFASEIAAKLDDSISRLNPVDNDDASSSSSGKHQFKSINKKNRRHLRNKSHDDS